MTSVVVSDGGGNIVEYVTVVEDPQQVNAYINIVAIFVIFECVFYNVIMFVFDLHTLLTVDELEHCDLMQ